MKYQKQIKEFIGLAKYDEWGGGYIWGITKKDQSMLGQLNEPEPYVVNEVLSVRGWGEIQGMFSSYEESMAFQNELGRFIADAINEKINREFGG